MYRIIDKEYITIGAPAELYRAIEDIIEDELGYVVDDKYNFKPKMNPSGIPNIADFIGTLKAEKRVEPIAKIRWSYIIAGIILTFIGGLMIWFFLPKVLSLKAFFPFFSTIIDLVSLVIGLIILVIGIVFMLRYKKIEEHRPLSVKLKLEGEAYLGSVKHSKLGETNAESMRHSILSRARLTVSVEGEDRKLVEGDHNKLIQHLKQVIPKFELPSIEIPETKP